MLYDAEGLQHVADPAALGAPAAAAWDEPRAIAAAAPRRRFGLRLQLALKRGVDIGASLGLIVLFAPLLLLIAAAILIIDRMPVLYLQRRYGRNAVPFTILKFRTMTVAETGRAFTQAVPGDARVTRLGAFLRRTSLDELPQLLNVLVGHMSLVGPRPHALVMEEEIFAKYPWARRRLDMRPGMTGLAQVRGLRGPTRRRDDALRRVEADVEFVAGWDFSRDIVVLLSTPAAWIFGRNAS
ncbi:MAG: sugar transferase [Candidatus Methylacidiphilales bacterium]|nr:sugar transferase [Candidatus Methylacidiphilales bacterium]